MEKVAYFLFVLTICLNCQIYKTAPTTSYDLETTTEQINDTNELYVIREIVYEVGILTDDNSSLPDVESHSDVAITIYNPEYNESFFDLSNIPVPIETNVSGHVVTGVAPFNLGSLALPISNESDPVVQPSSNTTLAIPNALVSITTNLSTTNPETGSQLLQELPLLGLGIFPNKTTE